MTTTETLSTRATPVERGLIHDLRNLFGIVASAKHMLEDRPADDRRVSLLAAIEDAAQRGGQLTSSLLAAAGSIEFPTMLDISNRLLMMAPMIRAMAGHHVEVRFDLAKPQTLVKLVPALFEAAILELVANASGALHLPGHILVRTRVHDRRVRITIADDGIGMDRATSRRAVTAHNRVGVNGTGLGRVRDFALSSHGRMRLRSQRGRGTVVALTLPMVLQLSVDELAAPPERRSSPRKKGH